MEVTILVLTTAVSQTRPIQGLTPTNMALLATLLPLADTAIPLV